jgi:hypothetical protein
MEEENDGMGGRRPRKTEAQRLAEEAAAAGMTSSGPRVAKTPAEAEAERRAALNANAEKRKAAAAQKKAAGANFRKMTRMFKKVTVPGDDDDDDDDLLAGLLGAGGGGGGGGAAAAAPAPARPSELLPLVLQAKAEHESAIRELEEITKNNVRENNGTIIAQSVVGLRKRTAAEQNLIDKKAAFDEVYNQYLAQGGKPLTGGRKRRAKKTKRRAHKKRSHTKRR